MGVKGRVAVVTGASRGIGRAVAKALAKQGADVALLGRDTQALSATSEACRAYGVKAENYDVDLMKRDEFEQHAKRIVDDFGSISILINNAGSGGGGQILDADPARWDQCLETNVLGLMHWTRTLAPEIVKHDGGAVINIASIASRITYKGGSAYAASKHAVAGFTGCLYEDIREYGIKVCSIMPGFVDTEMVTDESLNREKMIAPEDVAEAIMYVLNTSHRICPTEIVLRPQRTPYQ